MNENVKVVFGLIGGLALFLYGMNSMSDALQKAAGEKMKKILEFLTKNPIMGALAGALVTAMLQSSSATTVMVIGFVSAGLMSLPQAISVIFGANIGTTMTAQLMAFKISDYIYPLIFIGFMLNFLGKKEKVKNIGMVIFSFGLLFEGIEIMGSVMKPLAGSPIFVDLMGKVSSIPVLGVVLGAVMTLVVQSSSATIAVLQSFASQAGPDSVSSVIGLTGAIPILLGDNIGTTITALLASIGQSKDAKRTAIAHSIFNITGTCVFIWIIPWFAQFVRYISPKGNEIDVISRQIANAHTTFNVVCTLVWLPLIPLMVKIVTTIIRGRDKNTGVVYEPKYLDNKVIDQPVAAMYLVSQELENLTGFAVHMLNSLKGSLNQKKTSAAYEKFKNQLDIVVDSPEPPVKIMADGRHLWRVIDNLMSNICKYAMPGTRVYISLEKFNGMVIMTFRNISKSQLNISSEELMERFVRGDSSRNTEGSGLGLSIAQSLTGLMNGNFAIQIDGDLFKAILSFEEVF